MDGLVSFDKGWIMYRDGFGSSAGNDNYWLGLEKVYRLVQLGNARLRVEVKLQLFSTYWLLTSFYRTLRMLLHALNMSILSFFYYTCYKNFHQNVFILI